MEILAVLVLISEEFDALYSEVDITALVVIVLDALFDGEKLGDPVVIAEEFALYDVEALKLLLVILEELSLLGVEVLAVLVFISEEFDAVYSGVGLAVLAVVALGALFEGERLGAPVVIAEELALYDMDALEVMIVEALGSL